MSDAPNANIYGTSTYWRASMTMPRFIMFDARLVASIALVIFHLRLWTLGVLVLTAFVLWGVEHYGYRLPNALRRLRALAAGRYRPARPSRYYRTARDVAFEEHPLTAHTMIPRRRALARAEAQRLAMEGKAAKPKKAPSPTSVADEPKRHRKRGRKKRSDPTLVGSPA